jgi:hypothetical protein
MGTSEIITYVAVGGIFLGWVYAAFGYSRDSEDLYDSQEGSDGEYVAPSNTIQIKPPSSNTRRKRPYFPTLDRLAEVSEGDSTGGKRSRRTKRI